MTARVVVDRMILRDFPYALNPAKIVNDLTGQQWSREATFLTSLVVRYTPGVSSETPGTTYLAICSRPSTELPVLAAAEPKIVTPVWKGAAMVVGKEQLNPQRFVVEDSKWLYLNQHNSRGTVDISCTILTTTFVYQHTINPASALSTLNTRCFVGPTLAGFSLVMCMPKYPQPQWKGRGYTMNFDLRSGRGITSNNLYIKTPANRDYVVIKIGSAGVYDEYYPDGQSRPPFRNYKEFLWEYDNSGATDSDGMQPEHFGVWAPIHGSDSWWADVRPRFQDFNLGGFVYKWYYPFTLLYLYYEYPGVDVFDARFEPSILCELGEEIPYPSAGAQPNRQNRVPLGNSLTQCLWSAIWGPMFDDPTEGIEQLDELTAAKNQLITWPVYKNNNTRGNKDEQAGWRLTHGDKHPSGDQ